MKNIIALLLLGTGLNYQEAHAYPQYVRLGYHSCVGCHYNPSGAGLLTPYGKGISSTQSLYSSELSYEQEEQLSKEKYHQAFQGRLLDYKTSQKNRFFPMQAEYLARLDFDSHWKSNFTLALAPRAENEIADETPKTYQRLYARVAEIHYHQDSNYSYLFGMAPLPLGLGLVDHTHYVRANNRLQITDIPISFRTFGIYENFTFNYFFYLPHYLEGTANKEHGLGGQYWYLINRNTSLGLQALGARSKAIERELAGVLFKTGWQEYSYLGEFNYTHRLINQGQAQFGQWSYYNQFAYHPMDWLELSYTYQGLKKDRDFKMFETRQALMIQAKLLRSFTLTLETRLRNFNSRNEISHLLQGFIQWW